jgi:hypothetical protein
MPRGCYEPWRIWDEGVGAKSRAKGLPLSYSDMGRSIQESVKRALGAPVLELK